MYDNITLNVLNLDGKLDEHFKYKANEYFVIKYKDRFHLVATSEVINPVKDYWQTFRETGKLSLRVETDELTLALHKSLGIESLFKNIRLIAKSCQKRKFYILANELDSLKESLEMRYFNLIDTDNHFYNKWCFGVIDKDDFISNNDSIVYREITSNKVRGMHNVLLVSN